MIRPSTLTLSVTLAMAVAGLGQSAAAQTLPPNLAPQAPAAASGPQVGASVPFTTYEAENAVLSRGARKVALTGLPARTTTNPQIEASGRAYVELDNSSWREWVEFRNVRAANAMVVRNCVPDAPGGGGKLARLNVYVNGVYRQTITLTSRYNWLYGAAGENGQSNDPAAGDPHVFWDDARFVIKGGLRQGDRLRFQKDPGSTAEYYLIDLVDLETIPAVIPPPAAGTYVNVRDFGAVPNNQTDDTAAIAAAIAAANAANPKKIVYIPPGMYIQTAKWTLDGVQVQGAGYWFTSIIGTVEGSNFAGNVGFSLRGSGSGVSDLYVASTAHTTRSGAQGGKPFTANPGDTEYWSVKNVWITHTLVAFWMSMADHGVVRGCRVYFTYADGININRGASHNLVTHNYIRGTGDDGFVTLSEVQNGSTINPIATNNSFRNNTVIANWWGHNAAIGGGGGHVYAYNYLADNSHAGVLSINLPDAYPKNALTSCVVRGNMLVRGGSNFASQKRGALWLNTGYTTANATFIDTTIIDPIFRGIHVVGDETQDITFFRTLIQNPGEDAVRINSEASGSGTFINTRVVGLKDGFQTFSNAGGDDYALSESMTTLLP